MTTLLRRYAWLLIIVADAGWLVWGLMAALAPEHLPGPFSGSIVVDGYQGFTGGSWAELATSSPRTAGFVLMVFRMFGAVGVAFSGLAIVIAAKPFRRGEPWAWWALLIGNTIAFGVPMAYDRIVGAIGPFEMLEYVGIALIYAAMAVTVPRAPAAQAVLVHHDS